MASSPALIALISFIYRISINLPDVPYSAELKKTGSEEFKEISQRIFDSINFSLKDVPGFHNLTVKEFRYQQVIGTLASLEILSTANNGKEIRRIFEEAINSGHLNWLPVAPEGFEFYEFKVNRTKNGKYELHAAKPTVTCPDGTLPEYSLHGSTYCWSHSVCPSGTACIQSQCCKTAKNEKRSIGGCASGEYQCDSGECVPKHKQCDRHYDCQDGTDELKCDYFINAQRSQPNESQGHRRGNHDEQIHENSIHSRPKVTEQTVCTDQEFRCPHLSFTKCVHYDKLCDGVDDCGDNSDEAKCESGSIEDRKCEHGEFQCSNGQCISETKKCNRHYDCDDGTDETECEYFKAASTRQQNNRQNGGHAENNQIQERERQLGLREEEESRREAEERRREHEERRREHEDRRREEEFRQREEESQRRNKEERDRLEEERRRLEQQSNRIQENVIQVSGEHEVRFKEEYDEDECLEHEFMCGTGECIDRRRVCDTRPDCLDSSDEHDCNGDNNHDRIWPDRTEPPRTEAPSTHAPLEQRPPTQRIPQQHPDTHRLQAHEDIQITIYPHELSVRDGRDGTFECRARTTDNTIYPEVRWTRVGGPLPTSAYESSGRLTLNPVSLADAGRYVCVATYNGRSVEAYATLHVQSYGPQELQHGGYQASSGGSCMADEKLCGTSECVKSDYVCDGEPDCRDRSDESNCPAKRLCEPNEFKCDNDRCVQKMWLCDGDDDCGDGSDERNCEAKKPGELCQGTEFRCNDNRQCIPRSFQCDGTNDCHDGSDEVGCIQPTVVQPPETQKQVPQGQTFKLNCKAVAVPEPYINWRLNWGPVCDPPRCVQESEGGVGTLTVHNAQPLDQGAYTCEAINVKGRVLATPDCIVRIVDQPLPPPPPPPTQPPRPSIQCDSVGSVTPYPDTRGQCQCKPLVVGPTCQQCRPGTYHLDGNAPQGCLKCFCFGITDQCRSSNWYRTKDGACEKLYFNGDSEGITLSTIDLQERPSTFDYSIPGKLTHRGPHNECLYWNLPQRFRGNKVTAYGGKMAFELQYSGSGILSDQPIVVLKGNGITLVHRAKDTYQFQSDRAFTYTVETYEKNYEHLNGNPASREDLMMVLADLDAYLIRATHVQSQVSTSLGDVSWEIAVDRDTQEGLALEVEQCVCPPGYIGTSCEDCAPGYERSGQGPYLGTCVLRRRCECNGHSSSCDNEYGYCHNCQHNTEGDQCERCKPGYEGDARRGTPNDCQPVATRPPCECNNHSPRGCDSFGRCLLCEHSTEGYHCETCKKGFYGDATRGTPYDCTPCPCPGASECFLDQNGQVQCRNCPAGYSGRVCDACAPGYTRSQKTGGRDCEPIGRVQEDRIQFVDHPEGLNQRQRHRRRRYRVRSRFFHH